MTLASHLLVFLVVLSAFFVALWVCHKKFPRSYFHFEIGGDIEDADPYIQRKLKGKK